jgi:hypothetical protein
MHFKTALGSLAVVASMLGMPHAGAAQQAEPHGWLGTETLRTPYGEFEFENGYPVGDTAQKLLDLELRNRAIEVYLTNMMAVSQRASDQGLRDAGVTKPNQVVIWEQLMDSKTLLLTANTETVYAIGSLNLKADGPTVVEAPPKMLGFLQDGVQRYLMDIGPLGSDKGAGGKFLILPPGYEGEVPEGYFVARSPTYSVMFAMRGFQVDNKTNEAVALMKQTKVYPLSAAALPPAMEFLNGTEHPIDALFPDNYRYFELLAQQVEDEPLDVFGPLERAQMLSIGIEKGKPFAPDDHIKQLLSEAAQLGGAIARARAFGPLPADAYYYEGKQWQGAASGHDYTFSRNGAPLIDDKINLYYMAAGNSPSMMDKNVGQGSQYLWTYRDADGDWLDGGKTYTMHIPPNIPAQNFWSVVVYDPLSRSQLQTSQRLPSVSSYTNPVVNADGSVDITFGPTEPEGGGNWIETVPGRGFFPMMRFYSPTEAYFDKTWKLEDVVAVE